MTPLSESDYDRQHCEAPTGPTCSRCGKQSFVSMSAEPDVGIPVDLNYCPTDGEFYLDREGWSTRQVFLDDSAPTVAVPVEVADVEGECDILF